MKIVFITSRFPYPVEKGDKLRAYYQLRELSKRHKIVLIALTDKPIAEKHLSHIRQYCEEIEVFQLSWITISLNLLLSIFNGLPLQVSYFFDRRRKQKIQNSIIRHHPDHIYAQLIRTAEYVRALPYRKTLDYMDVFSIGMEQRASNAPSMLRWLFHREVRLLKNYEKDIYKDFDHHCIISVQDKERLPIVYRNKVAVVSNGVDTEYFRPVERKKKYDIVFVGNMGYQPNIEAAEKLINECMPAIWKRKPEVSVLIAGARPDARVKKLASALVTVSGWIDDIRDAYASARIFAAPITSGIGQQNKILEAMAMGLPCITTAMVNSAIGAPENTVIMVADDNRTFCEHMHLLLSDPEKRKSLGAAGQIFVEYHFNWTEKTKVLENLFEQEENLSYSLYK